MAGFLQQFKAFVKFYITLKIRVKASLIQEIISPIYFVAILAIIRATIKIDPLPAVSEYPNYNFLNISDNVDFSRPLYVCPDSLYVQTLANSTAEVLQEMTGLTSTPPVQYFSSCSTMTRGSNIAAGIIFQFDGSSNYSYAIRLPISDTPDPKVPYNNLGQCRAGLGNDNDVTNCAANSYLHKGFSLLQVAINTALLRDFTGNPQVTHPDIQVEMMPKENYQPSTAYIQIISAIYFVMAYAPFISFLCALLVTEKEKKIKEGMQMMGLNELAHSLAIGLIYLVIIAVITGVVSIIAVLSNFFENSNIFIFYLILLLYGLTLITLAYLMAPFFTKANTAGGVSSLASMVVSCLYLIVSLTRTISSTGELSYKIPPFGRGLLCLLSPVAVALALDQGIYLDITGGMTFDTMTKGEFPLYIPIIMMVVDAVIYLLLARYLENVLPGRYGARQKPWYLFTKEYWCGKKRGRFDSRFDDRDLFIGSDIEDVPSDMQDKSVVRICDLYREFKTKDEIVKAINGLSLEMYEGQITCLLGHNGAGKTTLINILSGLMRPTKGNASVLGYDISSTADIEEMRLKTGVCPQHNILHDVLTCVEHLQLYAAIKGVDKKNIPRFVEEALQHVGLEDQKNKFAKDLSGGQKRKLSVAIAIIGDPKIIFLDEPTAGMDPYSRRHLWSVLKEKKKGRVILLTTHFMDEADILADRKAIISKGRLRCCGSSLFLKNKFGIGYHLNMVVEPVCDRDGVTKFVTEYVPGAKMQRTHGKELAYTLPLDKVSHFPALFSELEKPSTSVSNKAESMGIKSYGVSMTTLEEVFLKLEEDDAVTDLQEIVTANQNYESKPKSDSFNISDDHTAVNLQEIDTTADKYLNVPRSEENLTSRQFWALCRLKFLKLWRNKPLLVINAFLPVVLVVVGLIVGKLSAGSNEANLNPPALDLGTQIFTYAGTVGTTSIPPLLLKDSAGTSYSTGWTKTVMSLFRNESYSSVPDLIQGDPHYVGIDVTKFDATGTAPNQVLESNWTLLYNATAAHSIPSLINSISNGLLDQYSALYGKNATSRIVGYSKDWPADQNKLTYNQGAFSSVILLAVGLLAVAPGFAVDLVMDREKKARCQLRVSGVTLTVYWLSNFFVDIVKFLVPAILILIIGLAMQIDSLKNGGAVLSIILIFITYIPALTLFSYIWSFAFKKYETCQAFLTTLFFFFGFMPYLAVSLVDLLASTNAANILHSVLSALDTPYLIFGGIYYIDKIYRQHQLLNTDIKFSEYFEWSNNVPITYIMPLIQIPLYFFLIRILDIKATGGDIKDATKCFNKNKVSENGHENTDVIEGEDEDVSEERRRVEALRHHPPQQPPVTLVEELRKEYVKDSKTKGCCGRDEKCRRIEGRMYPAVRNATFAVDAGEVFGLLGPNGAGKTTTLNMVIAETQPTKGKVMIAGHNIRSAASEAYTSMGYCPQHDALWDMITLQEHIELYAAIQGIPAHQIKGVVDWFMESLKIDEHKKKAAKDLSGGTKRKLSYCISMLGNPKAVLLDEPSTGMDPQSKRFLWDTISMSFSGTERGAILTTHYMEEADALCTRIAIMVNGKMECIGASQHLKYKYGSGYLLEAKLRHSSHMTDEQLEENMTSLEQYIKQIFPDATLMEKFDERAQYKVPKANVKSLAQTFQALENAKQSHSLEEYSFSQSTLEQVFLEFAKRQKEEGQDDEDHEDTATPMPSPINGPTNNLSMSAHDNAQFESVKL